MSIKKAAILLLAAVSFGCAANLEVAKETAEEPGEKWPFAVWEDCAPDVDDHPCNFTLLNSKEEEVSLYDFYGNNIVLDFSAMWCGPCNMAAADINTVKDSFPGITYITVLIDNEYGEPPSSEDLEKWSSVYEISEPVLSGDRTMISQDASLGWPITSWPTFFYINKEMILEYSHGGYSIETISQNIQTLVDE